VIAEEKKAAAADEPSEAFKRAVADDAKDVSAILVTVDGEVRFVREPESRDYTAVIGCKYVQALPEAPGCKYAGMSDERAFGVAGGARNLVGTRAMKWLGFLPGRGGVRGNIVITTRDESAFDTQTARDLMDDLLDLCPT
jgi:hypothetical protein